MLAASPLAALLLTACAANLAIPPTLAPLQLPLAAPDMVEETAVAAQPELTFRSGRFVAAVTPDFVPTPSGIGVRPADVVQAYVPDAGPVPPVDWRPAPYPVPLSLHYDDHYWLARPIPSGSRNYDLEWYPFGNDVQLPSLPPYRIHHGLDFPNETGTPVLAAGSGTVVHAGPLTSPLDGVNYYGNTVIIRHDWQWQGQDVYTLYAHTLELFVAVGDQVDQGELIAGVGSSGEVSGPHLHLEVRVGGNTYGDTRNPALWLAPFSGWGTVAGRFVDKRGRRIAGATLTLRPLDTDTAVRKQQTYDGRAASDGVWRENFVFGDVPAGTYELLIDANNGTHLYKRTVTVFPGQTSFEIISTNFDFEPTATPLPPPTAEPAATPGSP